MLFITMILATAAATGAHATNVFDITAYGAVAGSQAVAANNTRAINAAFAAAATQTAPDGAPATVLVPTSDAGPFWALGGIAAANLANVTVRLDGDLTARADTKHWPRTDPKHFAHFMQFTDCVGLTLVGEGTVDGRGVTWWNKMILPALFGKLPAKRPKLVVIQTSTDVLVDGWTLVNSPSFHLLLTDVLRVEVRNIDVVVDRAKQRALKAHLRARRRRRRLGSALDVLGAGLQPEDLNTDGIDPSGADIWIHDCRILNDDDSIAVKPCSATKCPHSGAGCTANLLVENMVLTGFGASIGSVPPEAPTPNCVRNVTFRNISMPGTGKGVYVKSNPTCGDFGKGVKHGVIQDILYEDISITKPSWWAVWIGPQQQQEPHTALGRKCSLLYPLNKGEVCPTQGCVDFRNITLRRVTIVDPALSPGVLLGNATNPMQGVLFDTVRVVDSKNRSLARGYWPFKGNYECEAVHGRAVNSVPVPPCFSSGG